MTITANKSMHSALLPEIERLRVHGRRPAAPSGVRVYAVGDIHGRVDLLDELLALIDADVALRPNVTPIFVFLGDYIDRGASSRATVSRLIAPNGTSFSGHVLAASVINYVRGSDVEEILIGARPERWSDLHDLLADLRVLPFPVNFIPVGTTAEIFRRPRRELGSAICLELQRGLLTRLERMAKRLLDIVIAGAALISLLPLLAIVAIAIKVDSPGPVLFRQRRCGFNGKSFQIKKFRTMSVLEDGHLIVQAKGGDKRITRLGVWLRKTSIDELPQLFNVLDGSMSLVGPRPHAAAHDNEFDEMVQNYAFRRRMKPGLTGWAQVHGCRGPTPTPESIERRVEFDLWYIDNWSLSLDLAILFWTPIELIRARNAY